MFQNTCLSQTLLLHVRIYYIDIKDNLRSLSIYMQTHQCLSIINLREFERTVIICYIHVYVLGMFMSLFAKYYYL